MLDNFLVNYVRFGIVILWNFNIQIFALILNLGSQGIIAGTYKCDTA